MSFTETIVTPNQKQYPWYHQRFRRVPTVDQCYTDDVCCIYEADQQFKRDRKVDSEILSILRQRFEDCVLYEAPDHLTKCQDIHEALKIGEVNWFSKCYYHFFCNLICFVQSISIITFFVFSLCWCRWRFRFLWRCKGRIYEAKA